MAAALIRLIFTKTGRPPSRYISLLRLNKENAGACGFLHRCEDPIKMRSVLILLAMPRHISRMHSSILSGVKLFAMISKATSG